MNRIILGVDPGLYGALCFIDIDTGFVDIHDMPNFTIEKPLTAAQKANRKKAAATRAAKKAEDPSFDPMNVVAAMKAKVAKPEVSTRRFIDHDQLGNIIRPYTATKYFIHAFIEQVSSRPTDGGIQAFSFGYSFCAPVQCCADFMIPREMVTPAKWKKDMKITGDKDESRRLASKLMPYCAPLWTRVMDDGRAEAALIALWGVESMRHLGGCDFPYRPSPICGVLQAA